LAKEGKYGQAALSGAGGVLDVASMALPLMQVGRMASTALPKNVPRKQAGMFIGEKAKTWNKANNAQAVKMEKAGVDPRQIWTETGNWKAPDGKWRQEIPDNEAKWLRNLPFETRMERMGNTIAHDPLYQTYPETEKITTLFGQNVNAQGGTGSYHFDPSLGRGIINIESGGSDAIQNAKSTGLHELQHAIQQREGFASGGSPEGMRQEALEMLRRDVASGEIPTTEQAMAMLPMAQQNAYRRLAGEAEARATQARMNMDMPQRLQTFPADSYDVPLDQLIVRYDNGPAMSAGRPTNAQGQPIPPTQYELAHAEAQRVAALPVEQGGLGLPVNNTAMDRARAMGFDADAYHGTGSDFSQFDILLADSRRKTGTPDGAVVVTSNPRTANSYANENTGAGHAGFETYDAGGNVMPLIVSKGKNMSMNANGDPWGNLYNKKHPHIETTNDFANMAKTKNKDSATIKKVKDNATYLNEPRYGDTTFIFDPSRIRSRFAAFNPANRDSADLLASYLMPATTTGLLGYGLLNNQDAYAR
jgi:hypothetical protein